MVDCPAGERNFEHKSPPKSLVIAPSSWFQRSASRWRLRVVTWGLSPSGYHPLSIGLGISPWITPLTGGYALLVEQSWCKGSNICISIAWMQQHDFVVLQVALVLLSLDICLNQWVLPTGWAGKNWNILLLQLQTLSWYHEVLTPS